MIFKPFSEDFDFSKQGFKENYPSYLKAPIKSWIINLLYRKGLTFNHHPYAIGNTTPTAINLATLNRWSAIFHKDFPQTFDNFFPYLFGSNSLVTNFLSFLLQNYASELEARSLEEHLSSGNSAYRVVEDGSSFILQKRVPDIVMDQANNALNSSVILQNAWKNCYKPSPDYEKAVRAAVDFMEGYFRDRYWPNEARTKTIYALLKHFEKHPDELEFKGSTFLEEPTIILKVLEGVSKIRGEHTTGSGREPTKDEAEYILHTVIYIWNLMEK